MSPAELAARLVLFLWIAAGELTLAWAWPRLLVDEEMSVMLAAMNDAQRIRFTVAMMAFLALCGPVPVCWFTLEALLLRWHLWRHEREAARARLDADFEA